MPVMGTEVVPVMGTGVELVVGEEDVLVLVCVTEVERPVSVEEALVLEVDVGWVVVAEVVVVGAGVVPVCVMEVELPVS